MSKQKLLIAVLAFFLVGCPMLVLGQQLAATLNGTVTDPSAAVIPNATVTIAQNGVNGNTRTIQTNAQGSYTVTNLPAGNYTVTVTATGFQTYTANDVVLFVAQTRSVNATLSAGATTQTVNVRQGAVALDTSTSALAGTISGTQVRELQLNNRNFEQLVTLQPGVVNGLPQEVGFGLNNTTTVAVNGARATANNWTVDGADINDSGSNSTLLNVPSVDAIQEFTLERSTYDAGYGRSGGGQVLVATKSGTSSFHGDAYEFNRNNIFNANSYFNKQTTPISPRAIERYNNYGFTIGGPLFVPKVFNTAKDKTFFFWSEEWRKVSSPVTSSLNPPSADELKGIFPGDLTGLTPPAHPGCITYNKVTKQSTITGCSQNAQVFLTNLYDKYPANNGNLYTASYSQLNNTREDLVRFDWNISQKLHFFGRAMQDETPQNFPEGLFSGGQFPAVAAAAVNAPGQNVVGNLTWTISPRMVNEAEFAYSQGTISSTFEPGAIADNPTVAKALTNATTYTDPYGRIPTLTFSSENITGFALGSTPYFERNLDRTLFDNFSATIGRHTVRVGATISNMVKTENASEGNANFTFTTFQNFELGNALQYSQANRDVVPDLHYYNFEAYAQDDWKVTQNLTLNLGLRYSYFPSPADVLNTLNNFDPTVYDPTKAPLIDSSDATLPGSNSGNFLPGQGIVPATYVNGIIFPKGKACSAAQAVAPGVTCSPFGSHVNPDPKDNFAPRVGFAYAPSEKMAIHGGAGIFYDRMLNGIWEQNAFQDPPLVQVSTITNTSFDHPGGAAVVPLGPNHLTSTGSPTMKNPYYIDYNLSVQDQFMPNTVAEIAYVGNQGRHLLAERDTNQPTLADRQALPLAYVTAVVPYKGYSWFADRVTEAMSNYNSLQVSLHHRTQRGLTLGIAYTWGRTLTDNSNDRGTENYDTYNPRLDYGPASLNQPQAFIANYVYELPFYRDQHGFVGHILGGWEVSGITELESGTSFTVRQSGDNFDCVTPAGAASGCIPGTYPGGLNMDVANIAPRPDQIAPAHLLKKPLQWFSTGSFKDAVGHFGSAPQGVLNGPGQINFDIAAMKNFSFGGARRLQIRGEFFNAFNHTNFGTVDSNTDSSTYGQVTSTLDPRQIQLGGKFYF